MHLFLRVSVIAVLVLNAAATVNAAPETDKERSQTLNKLMAIEDELQLTDGQKKVFRPMYDHYQNELKKLHDKRVELIEQFKASNAKLTDAQATEIIRRALALDEQRLGLKKRYVRVFLEKFPPRTVALYFQLENKIQIETDAQLSGNTPLINAGTEQFPPGTAQ